MRETPKQQSDPKAPRKRNLVKSCQFLHALGFDLLIRAPAVHMCSTRQMKLLLILNRCSVMSVAGGPLPAKSFK